MRRAFTLIECLISIALGASICTTAFICIRVASSSFTACSRLSIQNRVMRSAIHWSLDELDTWRTYDDPADPAHQPLRAWCQPFHPTAYQGTDLLDFDLANPARWWRGTLWTANDKRLGDYGLFARIDDPRPQRRWWGRLLDQVVNDLGYYALLDYAPAGAIYAYYGSDGNIPNEFGPDLCWGPYPKMWSFYPDTSGRTIPRDFLNVTHAGAEMGYFAIEPDSLAGDPSRAQRYLYGKTGFDDLAVTHRGLMPLRPTSWPEASIALRHHMAEAMLTDSATITVADPVDGSRWTLAVAPTATSLRGARRQRNLDGNDGP